MASKQSAPIRVFISYSQDSAAHRNRVKALSDRLIGEGVDCHLDQYEPAPAEGWPRWMINQIAQADFVLVICTENYRRRVEGHEEPGVGKGATWEGSLITQQMYDAQGKNSKFIPIVVSAKDKDHVPSFLGPFTHYDVSADKGYEDLYRHLTDQPKIVRPKLGAVRSLPPESFTPAASALEPEPDFHSMVLLMDGERQGFFESTSIRNEGGRLQIDLKTGPAGNTTLLASLQASRNSKISVAFGLTGLQGQVESVTQAVQGGGEIWSLKIRTDGQRAGGSMEMAFNGISADQLAEMRVKRILLNEKLPPSSAHDINNKMLELFVRGHDATIQVKESPLPGLYAQMKNASGAFIPAARLLAVLALRLSGAVEHISQLDMTWEGPGSVLVHFRGQRARFYSNVAPTQIEVEGVCTLA